ncbi:MAG: NADH-quinone oxidoreductase subunit C [Deltaproteobacteria bacterium]|nr:NADH-quinone oxidoreductase subunit C [Deltaproteobacteria bacterium]
MTLEEIFKELQKQFSTVPLELVVAKLPAAAGEVAGDSHIIVPADKLIEICRLLKVSDLFFFDCLSNLTAVDWKDRLEVVYHLFSYRHRQHLELKVKLPVDNPTVLHPTVPTVESIWKVANWLEREVFDLFGIIFEGHSDLRRIMLPDDWVGYPLRKDYKEEEDYHGITTTRPKLLQ